MHASVPAAPPAVLVTIRVRNAVEDVVRALDTAGIERDQAMVDARLERLFALSPYLLTTCQQRPDVVISLARSGALVGNGATIDELVSELRAGEGSASTEQTCDEAGQLARLRQFRHWHMVRILWRDLDRISSLDDTLRDLTRLAEACIIVATGWAETAEQQRSGVARDENGKAQSLMVLGMGKLGGGELNVSSDIDLIYLWASPGKTDGRRSIDNGEHFTRVARRLTRLLGSITSDGFVYRVDTRLRPFGESGPLAMHLDAFEHYLLTQGRDWERYAMIKARAITGADDDIAHLESLLRPFVYRRYIDYDALVSLASLKNKIHRSLFHRSEKGDNIKLGRGGIREVEFTAQAFQLMRGGRERRLQARPLRDVLATLGRLGYLPVADARTLIESYEYLRRVENALQAMRDEQTHVLPVADDDRARLVAMLGEPDEASLQEHLTAARDQVRRLFDNVLGGAGSSEDVGVTATGAVAVPDSRVAGTPQECPDDPEGVTAWLDDIGIASSPELTERLAALAGGPFHRRLTARAQHRVETILPRLAEAATRCDDPETALIRALDFTRAVAGRSGYLQALADRPAALDRVAKVFGQSAWVADLATRTPIVIDELIGESAASLFADADTIRREAMIESGRLAEADLERQMDELRHFRQARELRVALAALDGELTLMQVSDRLSWLAEAMIAAVLPLVAAPLAARYGKTVPALTVVAYGKLGGLELGFGSDLDLVFLRDTDADAEASARLLRRFVHFMATVTPAGRIYEIDLRLRPNGKSGVLVGTLDSFADYQRGDAWTWEHQALLRARAVCGDADAKARFESLRQSVLCLPRDATGLRSEVASMRERMRSTLGSGEGDGMDLKQDAGGIADIEFIVQFLALAHAAETPSLVRFTDNIRVLSEAGRRSLISPADAATLCEDYIELRTRLHRRALAQSGGLVVIDTELNALRERVIALRERILGPVPNAG